jgi:hypothetical protein
LASGTAGGASQWLELLPCPTLPVWLTGTQAEVVFASAECEVELEMLLAAWAFEVVSAELK